MALNNGHDILLKGGGGGAHVLFGIKVSATSWLMLFPKLFMEIQY